jgi:hypothetical protein
MKTALLAKKNETASEGGFFILEISASGFEISIVNSVTYG